MSQDTNTDILVAIATLETKVDAMSTDIKEMKDGVKVDIEFLKVDKISRADAVHIQTENQTIHVDFESRLRFLERYVWGALAILTATFGALQFLK